MEDDEELAEIFQDSAERQNDMAILRSRYLPDLILKLCAKIHNHLMIDGAQAMYKQIIECIDENIKAEFLRSNNMEALETLLQG
jgi:hypothetical protein